MTGKIYIASMNMRGKWSEPCVKNTIKINVTSAQAKTNKNRIDFSPMTEINNGYKGYWNFESYWQSYGSGRNLRLTGFFHRTVIESRLRRQIKNRNRVVTAQ